MPSTKWTVVRGILKSGAYAVNSLLAGGLQRVYGLEIMTSILRINGHARAEFCRSNAGRGQLAPRAMSRLFYERWKTLPIPSALSANARKNQKWTAPPQSVGDLPHRRLNLIPMPVSISTRVHVLDISAEFPHANRHAV